MVKTKYPKYKDSGIEWIGEIPEHWNMNRLRFLSDIIPSNVDKKTKDDEQKVLLCNYVDVYKNDYITNEINFMSATASDAQIEKLSLQKYDVIATKDSEDPNDIGVPTLVLDDMKGVVCGYHLTLFRNPKNINFGRFLYWYLRSNKCSQYFSTIARGITRYALGTSAFLNLPIPEIKDENEIITIANYLDRKTAEIDALIEKKQQLMQLYKEERTAAVNQAVTKGLDPTVPMKESGIEWLGEIPEHWEVKKAKFIFKSRNTERIPLSAEDRGKIINKEYDYYGASGVIDKVDDFLFNGAYILIGEDGANLVTRTKRLAFIADGKFWVNNHAHILEPIEGDIFYLCELLELHDYSIYISGSAQPKLTQEALLSIDLASPPSSEQSEIGLFLKECYQKFDSKITKSEQEIELLKEYKTALISEVVLGKVDVREEVVDG